MLNNPLVLGIDLGTSGLRIAIINTKKKLLYTSSRSYPKSLEFCEDWINCLRNLIQKIPIDIKERLVSCSVAGTSGTLLACRTNGEPIGQALPYFLTSSLYSNEINKLFSKECAGSSTSGSVGRALKLINLYGTKILLRHQADWVSGWLLNNWEYGEEGNNIRMGWEISNSSWPKSFQNLNWINCLPKIIPSGQLMGNICSKKADELNLPRNIKVIAGTTDSNAGVLATFPKKNDGVTILGSTIVIKKFVDKPLLGKGISNHKILGNWLCGGASNAGAAILLDFFNLEYIDELSKQINPNKYSGINLIPLSKQGERFPIDDPNLQPKLEPRPVSDSLYLHAIFEGLAKIEARGWQKLQELGADLPRQIITIGGGAKNITWKKIREREIGIPIKICNRPPAAGVASIALQTLL
ncbi:FGGY-family carbohydrate kinase [Prochlorococcus marinus]|uniref:Sugar kinase n=1 Tax=Prochlorococcus marinus XMU1408 TaxID=2213228 RepID=A0A318RBW9_PROMR|nr:sugar kinase [Prochlorococcus marinus]MBW3041377.1 sugar kinase [Prochlorococcus marinus str. XMU1408]PYE03259.1 sugar kinase [Prochlorococcus marinus XMU1408]